MGPELSRAPISLGLYFFVLKTFFFFFFWFCFVLVDFSPPGADAGFTKRGGGGAPLQALAPRALETLATPLNHRNKSVDNHCHKHSTHNKTPTRSSIHVKTYFFADNLTISATATWICFFILRKLCLTSRKCALTPLLRLPGL